jgi:hypothetical protein
MRRAADYHSHRHRKPRGRRTPTYPPPCKGRKSIAARAENYECFVAATCDSPSGDRRTTSPCRLAFARHLPRTRGRMSQITTAGA